MPSTYYENYIKRSSSSDYKDGNAMNFYTVSVLLFQFTSLYLQKLKF